MSITKGIVIGAVALMGVGCAGLPNTSRTGAIHDVKFEEHVMPTDLQVQAGDEVRWVNHRTMPVRIDFLGGALNDLACERGFSSFFGGRQESVTVGPNESASLCFSKAGTVTYNVRMDSAVPGGRVIESGSINVGPPLAKR